MFDYAILGGDLRFSYVAEMLADKGYSVLTANSLFEAIQSAQTIIGPIPLSRDGNTIPSITSPNAPPKEDMTIENLKKALTSKHQFFAGCISEELTKHLIDNNVTVYDFMKNEELTIYNTIATAEGAIAEAIMHQPTNIHGSSSLIIGFGRCAKTLAAKLKALSANTTICARRVDALAEAAAYGHNTLLLDDINEHIGTFEYIFNTVPAPVLTNNTLTLITSYLLHTSPLQSCQLHPMAYI